MSDKMRNVQKSGAGGKANISPELRLESDPLAKKPQSQDISDATGGPKSVTPEEALPAPEPVGEQVTQPAIPERTGWTAWLIIGLALVLRIIWLSIKPPHFDEGVNGWFVDQMTAKGYYHYDPGNYHGPFHFYVLFLMQTLFGRSVVALRMPLILINTATVWMIFQFQRFIPRRACLLAALAFAISPGMLFYSRYAIHESWFVFGMMLAFWGYLEVKMRGTSRGLWAVTLGLTLLMLTKETFIMHVAAFGLALVTLKLLELFIPSGQVRERMGQPQWVATTIGNAMLASLGLVVFFYSGAFLDPSHDFMQRFGQAFIQWSQTGVKGNGHEKPFYYWLQLLTIYEWPALIGLLYSLRAVASQRCRLSLGRTLVITTIGALVFLALGSQQASGNKGLHDFFTETLPDIHWMDYLVTLLWGTAAGCTYYILTFLPPMNRVTRLLAIYGCGTLVAYSIVPYKTPWCIISLIWPFLFLFGEAVDTLLNQSSWRRWAVGIGAGAVLAVSLVRAAQLNYQRPTDPSERYVYVQTLNDYFKLMDPLTRLVERDPTAWHMTGHVLLSSYHPLPWALGDFTAIGYYEKAGSLPPTMDAGFIVAEADRLSEVEQNLREPYFVTSFHLRDAMNGGKLYLNGARFAWLFPGRKPEFDPATRPPPPPPKPVVEAEAAAKPTPVEPPIMASPSGTSTGKSPTISPVRRGGMPNRLSQSPTKKGGA